MPAYRVLTAEALERRVVEVEERGEEVVGVVQMMSWPNGPPPSGAVILDTVLLTRQAMEPPATNRYGRIGGTPSGALPY